MEQKTYFPDMVVREYANANGTIKINQYTTTIRKKKGKIWREFDVKCQYPISLSEADCLRDFYKKCYMYLICTIIPKLGECTDMWGMEMYPKSSLQIEETERINPIK